MTEAQSAAARAAWMQDRSCPLIPQLLEDRWAERMTGSSWFVLLGGCQRRRSAMVSGCKNERDCRTSNEVKSRIKEILNPKILWKGDRIKCMKSAMTPQCKLCMVERKEICHRLQENKQSIINDNSDIFSSCKCRAN
eukprot:scaffold77721_cov103-Cyclotella_meneghiniana.AAC.1